MIDESDSQKRWAETKALIRATAQQAAEMLEAAHRRLRELGLESIEN